VKLLTRLLTFATLLLTACSTYESVSTPLPPVQGPPAASVTVSAQGVAPMEVQVAVGSYITFINADTRPHEIYSGVDHARPDCPEIDVIGVIAPGQSRPTRAFESARTCTFHDFENLGNPAFEGRVIVVR
jgi:hypothetical protein